MEPIDIFGAVIGSVALIALIAMLLFGIYSAEKTENRKRALYEEETKYFKHRNKMFEESEENK